MDEEKKVTLYQALQRLNELDEEDGPLLSSQLDAMDDMQEKVDAYYYVLQRLELETDFWKNEAAKAAKKSKAYKIMAENLEARMIDIMQLNHFTKLKGKANSVAIMFHEKVKLLREDPTNEDIYIFDKFIRSTHEFDKKAIKEALRDGDEKVQRIATIEQSTSLRWKKENGQ